MPTPEKPADDHGLTPGAYVLAGETACGKSDVAHLLAVRLGWTVCSADSMAVYRLMDIGTAKPTAAMRREAPYIGVDCVDPDQSFSVGEYLECVLPPIRAILSGGGSVLVAGGSGLYIKALVEGLVPSPPSPPDRVRYWTALWNEAGPAAARQRLSELSLAWSLALDDPSNPRRVIRALVLAEQGVPPAAGWGRRGQGPMLVGLRFEPEERERRIAQRAGNMYDAGLLDETRLLMARFPCLSRTARHAIGYAEAADCLAGTCTRQQALERTVRRSRRFAKRQRTWFRQQFRMAWVECEAGVTAEATAGRVLGEFNRHGLVPIA